MSNLKKENFILNQRNVSVMMLITAAFFWGSTFLFSKVLLQTMSVYEIIAGRSIIAGIILYIAYRKIISRQLLKAVKLTNFWLFSICAIVALILQTESLKYTTASNSAFITALFVVFIPFFKRFIFKEKIKKSFWSVVILAVAGLYIISIGFEIPTEFNYGDGLSLLCAVFYAYYIIILEKLAGSFSEGTIMFFYFLLQAVITSLVVVFNGNLSSIILLNTDQIIDFAGLAVIGSVIPYLLMAKGQQNVKAQVASIIYNLEPVSATLLASLFLNEDITGTQIIGCCVIFAALALSVFCKTDTSEG